MLWLTWVILALWRLREGDHEIEASLDYTVKPYLRKRTKGRKEGRKEIKILFCDKHSILQQSSPEVGTY